MISVPLEEERAAAGEWRKEFEVAFPVVFDPKRKIGEDYGIVSIPTNFAIDRNGKVVRILVGNDPDALDAVVKQLAAK